MEQHTGSANGGKKARELQADAQEKLDELRERMDDLGERVTRFIRERPGASLLIAAGAGYLIGRILRS